MSNTRHAEKNAPFRQEKYSSSAEFERGLMGNLVARRCEVLASEPDRQLIWWLQLLSWGEGGLNKLAADLISHFPARVATVTMQKYGFKPGQIYNAEKIKAVRRDMKDEQFDPFNSDYFPLRGESKGIFSDDIYGDDTPSQYPAADLLDHCRKEAGEKLPTLLAEICLDPKLSIASLAPWYFPTLVESLREYQSAWIEGKRASQVVTELGSQVWETLDYSLQTRCMVLLDGLARTGKTFSVKAWCDLHPGQARYVQVPSSNDDIGFFRAIAKSLGVSINQNSKAQQLRDRIEDVLQRGKLAIVFDEAHYLWPQSNYREALPGRVNWIMTALINQGVPVALVTTPQFMRTQRAIERKSCWTSEQFTGRIGLYKKLPDSLSEDDLSAVAKTFLPEGCARSIRALMLYAQGSTKYLAGIEWAAIYARFVANQAGRRNVVFADVVKAIKGNVVPSDNALALAMAQPEKSGRARAIAAPEQPICTGQARPALGGRETRPPNNTLDRDLNLLESMEAAV